MTTNLVGNNFTNIPALNWTGDHKLEKGKPVRFYEFPSDSAGSLPEETYAQLAVCQNTTVQIVIFSRDLEIHHLVTKFAIISGICLVGSDKEKFSIWQWESNYMKEIPKDETEEPPISAVLDYLQALKDRWL